MPLYSDVVMDHFSHPRNAGEIAQPDALAEVTNPVCGDTLRLTLSVDDGRITAARFRTFGCAAAIATSSMTTELLIGRTIQEAGRLTEHDIAAALGGLPPNKMHCAALADEGIQAALQDYRARQGRAG
jgi:nitrogen fixation NifU-like protein